MHAQHNHCHSYLLSQLVCITEHAIQVLAVWYRNHNTRAELKKLNPEILADIGISAKDADRESQKMFWE